MSVILELFYSFSYWNVNCVRNNKGNTIIKDRIPINHHYLIVFHEIPNKIIMRNMNMFLLS